MTTHTPNYSFPAPELTDIPDGATQMQNLASAIDSQLAVTDANVATKANESDRGLPFANYASTGVSLTSGGFTNVPWQTPLVTSSFVSYSSGTQLFTLSKIGLWAVTCSANLSGTGTPAGKYLSAFSGSNRPGIQAFNYYTPANSGAFTVGPLVGFINSTSGSPGNVGMEVFNFQGTAAPQISGQIQFVYLGPLAP